MALPLPPADWLEADCVVEVEGESSRTPGVGDLLVVGVSADVVLALVVAEQELPPVPVQEPEEFGDAAGVAGEFGDAAGAGVAAEGDEVPGGAARVAPPVVCARALGPDRAIATAAAR